MKIIKSNVEDHSISFCVYCCNMPDSQKDVIKSRDVLVAAERDFIQRYNSGQTVFNVDHNEEEGLPEITILKSEVLDKAREIEGVPVAAGCWYMKVQVADDLFETLSKGKGVSMAGVGAYTEE